MNLELPDPVGSVADTITVHPHSQPNSNNQNFYSNTKFISYVDQLLTTRSRPTSTTASTADVLLNSLWPSTRHYSSSSIIQSTIKDTALIDATPPSSVATTTSANIVDEDNSFLENSQILNNLLTDDNVWWTNAIEEDTFNSPLAFDASENGLWNGRFVPPPPRPPFLDDDVVSDGLTTCDLCTWAWQRNAYSLDASVETTGELGWAFTLIIVSIISALIGAIVMVIVLRCRRIKSSNGNAGRPLPWWYRNNRGHNGRSSMSAKHTGDSIRRPTSNSGVWTWLSNRRSSASPDQIGPPSSSPAENHYTHMEDAYSPVGVGEALYAELDRESVRSGNPSYQNTAYSQCGEKYLFQHHDQDIPMVSSAPSSAYYSDLSVTALPSGASNERAYEVVGLTVMSAPLHHHWNDGSGDSSGSSATGLSATRRAARLAAINESTTAVPSDYV
ncbi:uncharacterized protein LOC129614802 [Condylostylus longicornis]|uniref:uncharacterized protein LOC129614802 n=1 Tax=Condylostylus longicornis TaxID=2530218 RepID=UPI00244DC7AC|nr:uncharacterized protein LOC129614802 [Condylostylus longicornis]